MERANRAALLCLYSYLWARHLPAVGERLEDAFAALSDPRASLLQTAVARDGTLANSRVGGIYYTETGTRSFFVIAPDDEVTLVYRGSGSGEWIDNGQGLSGERMEDGYDCFGVRHKTLYATGQQIEALELACRWAEQYGWKSITVTGHSKGGNKAQFITLCTDLAERCYSFDGQGFSPEAVGAFEELERRRRRIYSISAAGDYVNVLGRRVALPEQTLFLHSRLGGLAAHRLEAILTQEGTLTAPAEQSEFSKKIEAASERVLSLPPALRRFATTGLMDLVQEYMGTDAVGNADTTQGDGSYESN